MQTTLCAYQACTGYCNATSSHMYDEVWVCACAPASQPAAGMLGVAGVAVPAAVAAVCTAADAELRNHLGRSTPRGAMRSKHQRIVIIADTADTGPASPQRLVLDAVIIKSSATCSRTVSSAMP